MKTVAKLLATTFMCTFLVSLEKPAYAICICEPGGATNAYVGVANTCMKAKDKILAQAGAEIGTACAPGVSFCGLNIVVTETCHTLPDGKKSVTGYYVYGCAICDDIPPNN